MSKEAVPLEPPEVIRLLEERCGEPDQFPANMARLREIVLEKKVALENSEKT